MSDKIPVVFVWHHHQPDYRMEDGRAKLPWTRLHCVKDYFPFLKFSQEEDVPWVVTFTPILLDQIVGLMEGGEDTDFLLLDKDPAQWSKDEKNLLVASWQPRINANVPIYSWSERLSELDSKQEAGKDWPVQDLVDLFALVNLSWMRVLPDELKPSELFEKGSGYSSDDLKEIASIQQSVVMQILSLLQCNCDKLETVSSAYSHPILPLLVSSKSGFAADAGCKLPKVEFAYPADALRQISYGLSRFKQITGFDSVGFWPPELAIDSGVVRMIGECGAKWIVADESILEKTFRLSGASISLRAPFYRMYEHAGVKMLFRDRLLSDLIGFEYAKIPEEEAAKDLFDRLTYLAKNLLQGHVITIALDGENCWEFYPNQGKVFLTRLCELLKGSDVIQMATPKQLIENDFPSVVMGRVATGSWIFANLCTWVGHAEKNALWEELAKLRKKWPLETSNEAWLELMAAEGSDWFWWAGDDHVSPDKSQFGDIFMSHLKKAAKLAGIEQ